MKQASDYANTLKGAALYARDKWDLHDAPVEGGAQQKEDGRRDRGNEMKMATVVTTTAPERALPAAYFLERAAEALEDGGRSLEGQRLAGWLMVMQMLADQTGQPRAIAGHPSEYATKKGWVAA